MTRSKANGQKKKEKGQHFKQKPITIDEASQVQISNLLADFREKDDEVLTFEPGLTNPERAAVHVLCRKMGLRSKSSGKGSQRCVSVFKCRKKDKGTHAEKANETLACLTFSEDSNEALQTLFTRFPPDAAELSNGQLEGRTGHADKGQRRNDNSFCKPAMNKVEIGKKMESFASRVENGQNLRQIIEARSKLPIASFQDVITSTLESHQVVLISGETGCGKTTQVPQYLLDHMWGKGEACKIVCTQPRRISATSVAERIAYERGENVGDTVGYKIRLETKGGKDSSIMFCTNGVLLRVLVEKGVSTSNEDGKTQTINRSVSELTHIIVDEIHERDRFSDFILAILRDMLPSYPHLRLILMSATLDAERFSQYFGGCPVIRVPGFTFPVETYYLEDVLSILKPGGSDIDSSAQSTESPVDYKDALDEAIDFAWSSDDFDPLLELVSPVATSIVYNYQHSSTGATPLMVLAGKGRVGDVCMLLSLGADCSIRARDGTTALEWAERENQGEAAEIIKRHIENSSLLSKSMEEQKLLENYLSTVNPENIDTVLIQRLLKKICSDSKDGAILVFLPGWDDINKTREKLLSHPFFQDTRKFVIFTLHSMVPSVEQKKVFRRPPHGCRKIILSTNMAETAVTIDDVVFVVDSGRMKEKSYDPYNNVSTLQSSWVSKASAKQRQGRAGRCQAGVCYHLYSKARASSLPEYQVPEIKRMPIEELCLQVKMLDPNCKIADFLQKTLDPPVYETIRNATVILQEIGALTVDESLTELGERFGSLPVHPLTSKMLLFSILMNCLDPALTLACASDFRDPFVLPTIPNQKKKALDAKAEFASMYGGMSDQLTVIAAFECWRQARNEGQESQFCSQYFVSSSTMTMLFRMRNQLQKELSRQGFIPEDVSGCSVNARNIGVLHGVLVAGMYPMVGKLLPNKGRQRPYVETASTSKVRLHQHSCNFASKKNQPLLMYDEITRGDGGMYIRNTSIVGPYPLFLLATEIVVAPPKGYGEEEDEESSDIEEDDEAFGSDEEMNAAASVGKRAGLIMAAPDNTVTVVIDRWLEFESTALVVAQMYCLRERLKAAILFKVKHPRRDLPPNLRESISVIATILKHDGLLGIASRSKEDDCATDEEGLLSQGLGLEGQRQMMGPTKSGSMSKSYLATLFNKATQTYYQHPNHQKLSYHNGQQQQGGQAGWSDTRGSGGESRRRKSSKRRRGSGTQ